MLRVLRRDLDGVVGALDGEQREPLVERPLHVELDLAVLVGDADGLDRRRAGEDVVARPRPPLADRFGEELRVPVAEEREALAVGERHRHRLRHARLHQVLERGVDEGGVLAEGRRLAARVHRRGSGEQPGDVDPDERAREQADGREHAEAAADAVRHDEGLVALGLDDRPQNALLGVGRHDDVPAVPLLPERVDEALAQDEELAHRLGGRTRLGDDVEEALRHVEGVEELADEVGIDVIEHEQPRLALGRRDVVEGAGERGVQRAIAEGRAADTEDDHVLELARDGRGVVEDVALDIVLVRQVEPAQVPVASRLDGAQRLLGGGRAGLELGEVDSVLGADGGREGVRVVEGEAVHGSRRGWRSGEARPLRGGAGAPLGGPDVIPCAGGRHAPTGLIAPAAARARAAGARGAAVAASDQSSPPTPAKRNRKYARVASAVIAPAT